MRRCHQNARRHADARRNVVRAKRLAAVAARFGSDAVKILFELGYGWVGLGDDVHGISAVVGGPKAGGLYAGHHDG